MDPSIIIHHIGAPFSRSKRARKKRNFVASNHNFFASVCSNFHFAWNRSKNIYRFIKLESFNRYVLELDW